MSLTSASLIVSMTRVECQIVSMLLDFAKRFVASVRHKPIHHTYSRRNER